MKKGYKSTEFLITAIGIISGLVMSAFPESDITNIVGGVLACVFGGAYTLGRSAVKAKGEQSKGIVAAANLERALRGE